MNNSSTLTLASTSPKTGNSDVGLVHSFAAFTAMASGGDKSAGDKSMDSAEALASTLKLAINRVIGSGGTLAKDTAAATREAADHAKRPVTRAVASTEPYVCEKPKHFIAIAAVLGAATGALFFTKRPRRSFVRFA